MRSVKKSYINKVFLPLLLLLVGVGTSMVMNYKSTGVFLRANRKVPIYCVETKEKKIALSFDASWGNDNTEEILDILDKNNVKVTFFIVGAWADQFPDKVKEMSNRGHEIGNHSYKHPDMTQISSDKIVQELAIADAKIRELTGQGTKLFRCPSGSYNDLVIDTVAKSNYYCIQWDVDSIDWKAHGADVEYKRVVDNVKPGSIVLFHNDGKYTPGNLPRIIEKLKKDGYTFVKVSELIYMDNYHIDPSGKQIPN